MLTTANERLIEFKRIAVLTDLSKDSEKLIQYGAALARWYGSELLLVHGSSDSDTTTSRKDSAEEKLSSAIGRLNLHGLATRVAVRKADMRTVLQDLEDYRPSLLVLASHGREGLRKWLQGSVAEAVFRGVQWPVLVLGPGFPHELPDRQKQFERVFYATDLSGASVTALQYAGGISHDHEASLFALYVEPDPEQGFTFDRVMALQRLSDWMQDHIDGLATTLVGAQCMVDFGRPEEKILKAAARHKADIVVLGARGLGAVSGLASHVLGGTAYKVICSAECPVLIVPQPR